MKTTDIAHIIHQEFPFSLQENYDNSGIILDFNGEINAILVAFDVTMEVILEAIEQKANLIISHHPVIFSGIKKLSTKNSSDQIIIKAIQHEISIIAVHTNIDNAITGVNGAIAKKLELKNVEVLRPSSQQLFKLVTYVPNDFSGAVRDAIFKSGAGNIGSYSHCSYNSEGEGTFMASKESNPFVGAKEEVHFEPETRIEAIIPDYLVSNAIKNLKAVHPYEEVAYDLIPIKNTNPLAGAGIVGQLPSEIKTIDFLKILKSKFNLSVIKHTKIHKEAVKTIAFCGGSGSFLISDAIAKKADIYITGDVKYHEFFDAQDRIIMADIGHFESEQHTIDIIIDVMIKKIPNFAILKTKTNSNPVHYFI